MDKLLQTIPYAITQADDILESGPNDNVHLDNLEAVLRRLQAEGLWLKEPKYTFMAPEVMYTVVSESTSMAFTQFRRRSRLSRKHQLQQMHCNSSHTWACSISTIAVYQILPQ